MPIAVGSPYPWRTDYIKKLGREAREFTVASPVMSLKGKFHELDDLVGAAIAHGVIEGQKLAAKVNPSRITIAALVGVQAAEESPLS